MTSTCCSGPSACKALCSRARVNYSCVYAYRGYPLPVTEPSKKHINMSVQV